MIDAAEKLPDPGHGRVLTALNVGQHPGWGSSTLGIETTCSDMLQSIYLSIGRPTARVEATLRPRRPLDNMPWTATVYGRGAAVRVRVVPDLPTPDNASLMDGHGVGVFRSVVADRRAKTDGSTAPVTRLAMPPLPGGNYILVAQTLDERQRVLAWSLLPFTVLVNAGHCETRPRRGQLPAEPAFARGLHDQERIPSGSAGPHRGPGRRPVGQDPGEIGRAVSHSPRRNRPRPGLDADDAERCSARLQVRITGNNLVLAQASTWLSTEKLMPKVDFHVGPYDDWYDGWNVLGADMLIGFPRPDLGLRPFPWIDLPGAMGPDGSCCGRARWRRRRSTWFPRWQAALPWTPLGCILHDETRAARLRSPAQCR